MSSDKRMHASSQFEMLQIVNSNYAFRIWTQKCKLMQFSLILFFSSPIEQRKFNVFFFIFIVET